MRLNFIKLVVSLLAHRDCNKIKVRYTNGIHLYLINRFGCLKLM